MHRGKKLPERWYQPNLQTLSPSQPISPLSLRLWFLLPVSLDINQRFYGRDNLFDSRSLILFTLCIPASKVSHQTFFSLGHLLGTTAGSGWSILPSAMFHLPGNDEWALPKLHGGLISHFVPLQILDWALSRKSELSQNLATPPMTKNSDLGSLQTCCHRKMFITSMLRFILLEMSICFGIWVFYVVNSRGISLQRRQLGCSDLAVARRPVINWRECCRTSPITKSQR